MSIFIPGDEIEVNCSDWHHHIHILRLVKIDTSGEWLCNWYKPDSGIERHRQYHRDTVKYKDIYLTEWFDRGEIKILYRKTNITLGEDLFTI